MCIRLLELGGTGRIAHPLACALLICIAAEIGNVSTRFGCAYLAGAALFHATGRHSSIMRLALLPSAAFSRRIQASHLDHVMVKGEEV